MVSTGSKPGLGRISSSPPIRRARCRLIPADRGPIWLSCRSNH
jgi:hypothetical protein